MSNLHNTTRLPLQSLMTNKTKFRLTNDVIERKTRALEGSLNKRKLTMQQNKTKPINHIDRPTGNKEIPSNVKSSSPPKQIIKCGQCEKDDAKMKCLECMEMYCSNCFTQFHLRGALQRHHCILLSTLPKKQPSSNANINLREFSYQKQTEEEEEEDSKRKSTMNELGESTNEKTSFASFQQSFLQWRDNNINKSKRYQQKRGLIPVADELPHIDSNSSKNSPKKRMNLTKKNQVKLGALINIHRSSFDTTSTDLEPLDDNLLSSRTEDSIQTISIEENSNNENIFEQNDGHERPVTHVSSKSVSRPSSSSIKKDLIIVSRPNSTTIVQPTLRSELATKTTDELEAIVDSQIIFSRSSSTADELDQGINNQTSTVINQNNIPEHTNIEPTIVPPLDLSDKTKTELNHLSDNMLPIISERDESSARVFNMNSARTASYRNSPFSFSFALNKTSRINSASSRDEGDGGFFTDVLPRQNITTPVLPAPLPPPLPAPILECSTSNEWKYMSEGQPTEQQLPTRPTSIPLENPPIEHISRPSSKSAVTLQPIIHHRSKSQTDNNSRPGSSLSSASLPVSITSSKTDFHGSKLQSSATSSRKSSASSTSTTTEDSSSSSSSSSTSTLKNSSTSTSETSSSADTSKSSSSATETTKTSSSSSAKSTSEESSSSTPKNSSPQPETITEDKKITTPENNKKFLPDENITDDHIPPNKKTHRRRRRQTTTSDEASKFRKLGFSIGDGLKWQEASMESLFSAKTISSNQSSNTTTPRSLTPSDPINTKVAEDFSKYDNDDGRSSLTYQNVNDEECFNQLREELCSELDTRGSDEDAILNEHILKILQDGRLPIKENETAHHPLIDNELLIN